MEDSHPDADHALLKDGGDPSTEQFMNERSTMLANNKVAADENSKGMVTLQPMSPLQASSTVVNLLLATGPFAYPYSFVRLGPVMSVSIMLVCCFLAYVAATFMVEAIAMANSQDDNRRRDSVFKEECYATPAL